MSQGNIFKLDADGFANLLGGMGEDEEAPLVVLSIARREIESGNISSSLERLLLLTDSAATVERFREKLTFQVTGYEHDRRELPEIPEVRHFFKRLSAEWPHWLYFLARGMGAIPLLLSLLCRVKIHRKQGAFGTEFVDVHELSATLMDLFDRGNALFDAFDVPDEVAAASSASAAAELVGD